MGRARHLHDAFGNGVFVGWSIVRPRKQSEANDPDDFFGDTCAWETHRRALGGHGFVLEPLWPDDGFNGNGNGSGDGSVGSR
jgi:hypothetical protein